MKKPENLDLDTLEYLREEIKRRLSGCPCVAAISIIINEIENDVRIPFDEEASNGAGD